MSLSAHLTSIFQRLNIPLPTSQASNALQARTPIDGSQLTRVAQDDAASIAQKIEQAHTTWLNWRTIPAPVRGQVVRVFGEKVRLYKQALGELISLEAGKILQEGLGEVQEVIDICEFAVGLSRQLYGLTIASERADHKLLETWHPLGVIGIISAFNFPMAVWAWNASLALVCGNALIWKPSEKTPLSAIAIHALLEQAISESHPDLKAISAVIQGSREVGEAMVQHPLVKLVSATGSTRMGRDVGIACAQNFKRSLLELGGNNAAIVCASADLALALRAIVFSAVGTAGQRCTSLRRLFIHQSIYTELIEKIKAAYVSLPIGSPLQAGTLIGPLIDETAFINMQKALSAAKKLAAAVHFGERDTSTVTDAYFVRPALVEMPQKLGQHGPMLEETFAPILYALPFDTLDQAIAWNNAATHGLSSCIFTRDLKEAERFTAVGGSDCGIANINIGTSGAEIGGAFGGEKETGGGRESGSDAWKNYMRRATNTINYGDALPLAQGIEFNI